MKVPVAIAELVSEFTGLYRSPDFKPVTSTTNCQRCPETGECIGHSRPPSGSTTPIRKDSMEKKPDNKDRRHSIVIAVGVDEIPVRSVTPPELATSLENPRFTKTCQGRRQSAPCISNCTASTTLKQKLRKVKRTNSTGSDNGIKEEDEEEVHFNNRRESVASYRLI